MPSPHKKARTRRACLAIYCSASEWDGVVEVICRRLLLPTVERRALLPHALRLLLRLLLPALVVTVEHRHVAENRPLDALLALLLAHILRHHTVVAVLALFVQ